MLVSLFLAGAAAATESNLTFSPAKILADSLSHSLTLKLSDQDITAAQARALQARSQFLPSLNLDGRAGHYEGLQDASFGPGIVIPTVDNQFGASATLSQPLFTGGRIINQNRSARYQTEAANHSRRSAEAGLRLQTLTTYWTWSKTYYGLQTIQAAVARMEAHSTDMHHLHQAGRATDNDTLSTDVQLDQTRLDLETVQRRNQLALAQIAFLVGYNLPSNAVPEPAPAPAKAGLTPENAALAAAKTNRAEYALRQMELNSAQAQVSASRANYFPQLYALARYEQARPNPLNFPPQDQWNYDAYIGLTLNWNILDWGLTRGKVAEAISRTAQARLRLALEDERIILEVRQARIDLLDAGNRLAVAERAEKSARRNLESATDLWHNGLLRHSELLDAHTKLTAAEHDSLTARTDVILAQTALDYALGKLAAAGEKADE
jgi:outer membrane protein TolC